MEVASYLVAGVIGYGFSVGLGYLIIPRCINRLYKRNNIVRDPVLPTWTGTLERILYTTVVLMGFGAFIPVWLLVKVGRGWRIPARVQEEEKKRALKEEEETEKIAIVEVTCPPRIGPVIMLE